jgi:ABC-type transporter Mla subunit MlaD
MVTVDNDSVRVPLQLVADPNYRCSLEDYTAQFVFLQQVQGTFNETIKAIKNIRQARNQLKDFVQRQGKSCPKELSQLSDSLIKAMTTIEEQLHQTKAKSGQDVLNYPIRLDDKLSGVFDMASSGNMAPPKQARDVYAVLAKEVDGATRQLNQLLEEGLKAFNNMVKEKGLPVIVLH